MATVVLDDLDCSHRACVRTNAEPLRCGSLEKQKIITVSGTIAIVGGEAVKPPDPSSGAHPDAQIITKHQTS